MRTCSKITRALPFLAPVLVAAACAPVAPNADDLPDFGPRAQCVVRFSGAEDEHLGIAIATNGDVDQDRRADLVLGSLRDARPRGAGPAFVRSFSIARASILHEAEGGDPHGADTFGERLAVVGDVDADGVIDFGVGARRAHSGRGQFDVRSGKTGALVTRIVGMPPWETDLGATACAAGDVDADGALDVAVSVNRSLTKVFRAKEGKLLAEFEGTPISLTGDLDGDSRHELLVYDGPPRDVDLLWTSTIRTARVVSPATGAVLLALDAGADLARVEAHGGAGDLDRDGFVDWIVAGRPNDTAENDFVPGARERRVRVLSGRTGKEIAGFSVELAQRGRIHLALGVGDLDGDGAGELLVSGHVEEGRPAAFVELRAFPSGVLTHRFTSSNWSFGTAATQVPDQNGDGVADLVLGEYESSSEARCGGRIYVVTLERRSGP